MNSFLASRRTRKALWMKRVAAMNAGRERKRLERTKDDPIRQDVKGKLVYSITFLNRLTGEQHMLDLRISQQRINAYDVSRDGKPWRQTVSGTRIAAVLRRKLKANWLIAG